MEKLRLVIKLGLLILISLLINYIFYDDVHSYTRIMLHELYEYEDNIDVVFIGSSHVYRGIDPSKADKLLDLKTFNASSSSQSMKGSYYLLREICKNNIPKTVFLDITYGVNAIKGDRGIETYLLTDYMKNDKNKYYYLLSSKGIDGLINNLLPVMHIFSFTSIKDKFKRSRILKFAI